jgi:hypothetical protein
MARQNATVIVFALLVVYVYAADLAVEQDSDATPGNQVNQAQQGSTPTAPLGLHDEPTHKEADFRVQMIAALGAATAAAAVLLGVVVYSRRRSTHRRQLQVMRVQLEVDHEDPSIDVEDVAVHVV